MLQVATIVSPLGSHRCVWFSSIVDIEIILRNGYDSNGYELDIGLVRKFVRFLLTRHVLRLDIRSRTAWMCILITFGRIVYVYIDKRKAFRIDNAKLCIYYFLRQSYEIGILFFVYYFVIVLQQYRLKVIFIISSCLSLITDVKTKSFIVLETTVSHLHLNGYGLYWIDKKVCAVCLDIL